MVGFFSKLFGGGSPTKKYEDIFFQATKMGQSVESGLRQAVEAAVRDGVYPDAKAAVAALHEAIVSKMDPVLKPEYEKAKQKLAR